MHVSVAICTWNRAELLRGTLDSLRGLSVPEGLTWEVVVVDNGCTDHTARVLAEQAEDLPLRTTREARPGHSHARNRAVSEARGRWVVWTDDDVLVDPGWLASYARAFERHPEAAFFGGPVAPHFASPPPRWLEEVWDEVETLYAIREAPRGGGLVDADYLPFGANYAVRADVQRAVPYDAALGHTRGRPVGLEELACMSRILADGGTGRWVAEARVRHVLTADRLSARYVRRLLQTQAELEVAAIPVRGRAQLLGVPVWLWKKWVAAELAYRVRRPGSDARAHLRRLREVSLRRGQIDGLRRRSRAPG